MHKRTALQAGWMSGVVFAMAAALPAQAQAGGIEGNWRNPSGSVIQAYPCGSDVCLKIVVLEKTAPGNRDEMNPDPALRSRALCGLQIGKGFHPEDGGTKADGGSLYDPKSGKTYSGSLQMQGTQTLKLRGYLGLKMFGRTEEWTRVTGDVGPCQSK